MGLLDPKPLDAPVERQPGWIRMSGKTSIDQPAALPEPSGGKGPFDGPFDPPAAPPGWEPPGAARHAGASGVIPCLAPGAARGGCRRQRRVRMIRASGGSGSVAAHPRFPRRMAAGLIGSATGRARG